jgi:hypothetical protein
MSLRIRSLTPYGKFVPALPVGGADRVRTGDLRLARAALSQLSYSPPGGRVFGSREGGGPKWIRTTDLTVISRAL